MKDNSAYSPLGKYIQLSKEKNTQLLATRHFGLSASEGLVELPLDKGKADKGSFWTLREGQIAIDLMSVGTIKSLAFGLYKYKELGMISNGSYTVCNVTNSDLNKGYLFLILKSQKTKKILLHYACHGVKMALPWEDFCSLPVRVPPPQQQAELVRKYSTVERIIKLKREINETLEKWMEDYYHILFGNLPEEQLEQKKLGDLLTIVGGGTPPSIRISQYWTRETNKGFSYIKIGDLTKNKEKFIALGERNITQEGLKNSNSKLVPEDAILFSYDGDVVGKMGICDVPCCPSNHFLVVISNLPEIGHNWFLLKKHWREFNRNSIGTTIHKIRLQDFREFSISLPPQEQINKFNQTCEPFFQLQKTNEREIRELIKLQKYFIEQTN